MIAAAAHNILVKG